MISLKIGGGNLVSGFLGGALSGAISGGFSGYKNAKELGANPWTRNKISSTRSFKTMTKPTIEGQADPTKHCYAVAGEFADAGHGNRSREIFLNVAAEFNSGSIPDGADLSLVAQHIGLETLDGGSDIGSFAALGKLLEAGNGEGVLAVGTDVQHAHFVNVVSFDIVEKFNAFGYETKWKVENLKIWDSIGAIKRIFRGNILRVTLIKY